MFYFPPQLSHGLLQVSSKHFCWYSSENDQRQEGICVSAAELPCTTLKMSLNLNLFLGSQSAGPCQQHATFWASWQCKYFAKRQRGCPINSLHSAVQLWAVRIVYRYNFSFFHIQFLLELLQLSVSERSTPSPFSHPILGIASLSLPPLSKTFLGNKFSEKFENQYILSKITLIRQYSIKAILL